MKFQPEAMEQITNLVANHMLPNECSVVVGDNSSGKSFFVRQLVLRWKDKIPVYFLDAVNRGFNVSKVTGTKERPEYKDSIVSTR